MAPSATRSAQIPAGYEAFSTFTPRYARPVGPTTTAPTAKREYGAQAFSATSRRGLEQAQFGRARHASHESGVVRAAQRSQRVPEAGR